MAAHLALMDQDVTLFNRTFGHIEVIAKRGGIDLESPPNGPRGFGALKLVTDNVEEALKDAEVIMVVVPSSGTCRHRQADCALSQGWTNCAPASGQDLWGD